MTRFKELRKENNMSQEELAAYLNIRQTTVGKWELGKGYPEVKTLIKLAELYDVSTDYLLGRSELRGADKLLEQLKGYSSGDIKRIIRVAEAMREPEK